MIEEALYKEILDNGLLLDHYFLLCNIKNGQKLVNSKRIQGFINLMTKKGYIYEDKLTEKGVELVQNCVFAHPVLVPSVEEATTQKIDAGTWVMGLHKTLEDRIFELTGQKQIRARMKGEKKSYPFLPNATDLGRTVLKCISTYKLKDLPKIERTLLKHIDKCNDSGIWFPLMGYYILKGGASNMVTDYNEEEDENNSNSKSNQKFI